MQHTFYIKTQRQQNKIQILIGLAAFIVLLLFLMLSWISGLFLVMIIVFPIVLSIIAPFFDVPSLKKSGKLKYYSLLFLSERPKNGVVKIHGGTLFDYVFVIDRKMNGKQRTNFIIQQYIQGLLNLIESEDLNKLDNPLICGTSYIINKRTAQRLGFKVVETDGIKKMILLLNYFNILLTYSIAKGKLSFPKLTDTITLEIKLNDLIHQKEYLGNLSEKLKDMFTSRDL